MTTTKNFAVIRTSNGLYHFGYKNTTDGTEASIPIISNSTADHGNTIGTALEGLTMTDIYIQSATPSDLDRVCLYNQNRGVVWDSIGAIVAAVGQSPQLEVHGLAIKIYKGYDLKLTTSD